MIASQQPEKLRPRCQVARPVPTEAGAYEHWKRETQRSYLLYLVGAIQRVTYKDTRIADARTVLLKLNGLGGEW